MNVGTVVEYNEDGELVTATILEMDSMGANALVERDDGGRQWAAVRNLREVA